MFSSYSQTSKASVRGWESVLVGHHGVVTAEPRNPCRHYIVQAQLMEAGQGPATSVVEVSESSHSDCDMGAVNALASRQVD